MLKEVENFAKEFLEETKEKPVRLISHFDTDGITSAAIMTKTLKRLDIKFSVRIVKNLNEEVIKKELSREGEVLLFTDLASSCMRHFKETKRKVFILDHHEIKPEEVEENIRIVNPHLTDDAKSHDCTGAGLCYLLSKTISEKNKDLAALAVIGIIGDRHEKNPSKINQQIINETEDLTIKKGLAIYPATRPLKRTLEYSTSPYIPQITGNNQGVTDLLKETKIPFDKNLMDLSEEEMSRLLTAIMIRKASTNSKEDITSNLYIIKFFNTKEDAREISTLINACSRQGQSDIAISYCLENKNAKTKALDIYTEYKHKIVAALKSAENQEKIEGTNFVILNAKDKIKDTIIGTICSIITSSSKYKEGTTLVGMAYSKDKIKVSARNVGKCNRDLKDLMQRTTEELKKDNPGTITESGGHQEAAGCTIDKEKEKEFIEKLKKNLEIEVIKV